MKNGPYEMITAPAGYPGMKYRGRYAYQHTIVWWMVHGAIPGKGMEIHHVNGNHRDNRIENLQLVTGKKHRKMHGDAQTAAAMRTLPCCVCGKAKSLLASRMSWRIKKTGGYLYCSRSCANKIQKLNYWAKIREANIENGL